MKATTENRTVSYGKGSPSPGGTGRLGIILVSRQEGLREIDLSQFKSEYIRIGRSATDNEVPLNSPIISSRHGCFARKDGRLYYADLGSTNGSYYMNNGEYFKLKSNEFIGPLQDGMVFLLGSVSNTAKGGSDSVLMIIKEMEKDTRFTQFQLVNQTYRVGRAPDCDIVLKHPAISRLHAVIYRQPDGRYAIQDNHSRNGVFINGVKIESAVYLADKDIIQIAGRILIYIGGMLICQAHTSGIEVNMSHLFKKVNHGKKVILSNVNAQINGNEFIAIVGGSGAGKSTLLKILGGYDQDYQGVVTYNGIPLRKYYHILKNIIGYVPQEDIVYENLSLYKMLYYTAKMKMPDSTSKAEIHERIGEVLSLMELSEHRRTMIRDLSGGQKKRASIAVELLADPGVFFLDEPTSGLDPGTEKKLMTVLSRLSKEQGKTIIMVTHTTQSLHLCDKILFMGKGGKLSFLGTPSEALDFFRTDDLVDIYNRLDEDTDRWAAYYAQTHPTTGKSHGGERERIAKPGRKSALQQLGILSRRYMELMLNDSQRLMLMFIQPVLIPLLIKVVASKKMFIEFEPTTQILFTFCCSAIWVGIFNTIQEICKERAILKREYMSNLRLTTYILSKLLVMLVLTLFQSVIFSILFWLLIGQGRIAAQGVFTSAFIEMLLTVWLTIYSSSSMGLLVSSVVKNSDRAMAVSPFLLIIQLLFSGVLFNLGGFSKLISFFTISRWSVESMGNVLSVEFLDLKYMDTGAKAMYAHNMTHLAQCWGMMALFILVFSLLCISFLQNVSKDR